MVKTGSATKIPQTPSLIDVGIALAATLYFWNNDYVEQGIFITYS